MNITIKQVPNILTSIRIILIPIICVLMYVDISSTRILAIILTALACITDKIDGEIARKYDCCSAFGKCMDPIADKTLVASLIIMLVYLDKAYIFPCIIILFREFVVSGIREFVSKERGLTINVSKLAKIKTFSQMFSLFFLMLVGDNYWLLLFGNILLIISAILSIITGYQYIYSVRKVIFE